MKEGLMQGFLDAVRKIVRVEIEPQQDANSRHLEKIGDLRARHESLLGTSPRDGDFYDGTAQKWVHDFSEVEGQILDQQARGEPQKRAVVLFNKRFAIQ